MCVRYHTWRPICRSIRRLIEAALEVSGEQTKRAAVTRALEEFVARHRQKRLLELMGKLEWDTGVRLQG